MRPIATACLAVLVLCQSAVACSWIPIPFCQTSTERPNDVVLSGRIVNVDMDGIDLEVIDVLHGAESRATIRIWDGTDWDCNGLFSMAASDLGGLNDSIIVILPMIASIENTWDVIGDYRRPDYFGYTPELRVDDGVTIGYIMGPAQTPTFEMPYAELLALWNDVTGMCSGMSVNDQGRTQPFVAHLVNDILDLTVRSDLAGVSMIRIHAANGQEMVAVKDVPGTARIDLSGFSTGVYHIVLVQHDGVRSAVRVLKL